MSVTITELDIDDLVEFETVLSERRNNYRYKGSVPWDIAKTLGLDVLSKHIQYSVEMGEGSPIDFKGYPYAIFKTPEGVTEIYGHPWIKSTSIELKDNVSYQMHIPAASEAQLNSLRSFATAIGIMGFKIEAM